MKVLPWGVISIFSCAAALSADTTFVDKQLNFNMYLPANWVCYSQSDSQCLFQDTTYAYPAVLSLSRYAIDSAIYRTADEWTQAHFLGYRFSVQYSVDPAGVILYSNADTTVKQGSLPAAEAYSIFFSSDTAIGSWAEYVRFTAAGWYGYELYAVSDTADMSIHIGYYAALLQGIVIDPGDRIISPRAFHRAVAAAQNRLSFARYDPLGRELRGGGLSRFYANGIYLRRAGPLMLYMR
jgi:hypothetical protein